MKKCMRFFSTISPVSNTPQMSAKSNLDKIRQNMLEKMKNKLKNDNYKKSLMSINGDYTENANALNEAIKKSEENFKYSY